MAGLKASYVLAIYNAERTIRECLDSILNQNMPMKDYEIIIVDGKSTDSTLKIIKEYAGKYQNIHILINKGRFSEGPGMGKAMGIERAKSEIVILLDHDNILIGDNWLGEMIYPLKRDKKVMASQSMLSASEKESLFLEYVNEIGVEDAFAIANSLVSQVSLYPRKFELVDNSYYIHNLDKNKVLFGGANGCAFRKSVFKKIGGYTRDVDVFSDMAEIGMKVAVPKNARIYHKTSTNLGSFFIKKGKYFYRFINEQYRTKKYRWIDSSFRGRVEFALRVCFNLSLIGPAYEAFRFYLKKRRAFWIIHSPIIFFTTLEYSLITLTKIRNFISYAKN